MDTSELKAIIESLLFVSEEALTIKRIQQVLDEEDRQRVREAIHSLVNEYKDMNRAFSLVDVAGGYQFRTRPKYRQWIRKLVKAKSSRMSKAALETLAIVAYKQPVVKAEIEQVRGVDVGSVLKSLLEKDLIRILGRKDVPGKPILYGTSRRFLELFSLKDLSGLPTLEEIEELGQESL